MKITRPLVEPAREVGGREEDRLALRGVLVGRQRAEMVVVGVDRVELGGFEAGNIAASRLFFDQELLISS